MKSLQDSANFAPAGYFVTPRINTSKAIAHPPFGGKFKSRWLAAISVRAASGEGRGVVWDPRPGPTATGDSRPTRCLGGSRIEHSASGSGSLSATRIGRDQGGAVSRTR